jgi:antitoxin component HigA of HigAB toxin-antitoxin module
MARRIAYKGTAFPIAFTREKDDAFPGCEFFDQLSLLHQAKLIALFRIAGDHGKLHYPTKVCSEGRGEEGKEMKMKTKQEEPMESAEFRKLMAVESLTAEASETIARLMAEQKVSKADLARRLNKSRAWVTQLLSGKTNMTVRTLAEVSHGLGFAIMLHARACGASGV